MTEMLYVVLEYTWVCVAEEYDVHYTLYIGGCDGSTLYTWICEGGEFMCDCGVHCTWVFMAAVYVVFLTYINDIVLCN